MILRLDTDDKEVIEKVCQFGSVTYEEYLERRALKGRPNESRIVKGLRKDLGTMVKRVQELEELVISWKRIAENEREEKKALLEMRQKA